MNVIFSRKKSHNSFFFYSTFSFFSCQKKIETHIYYLFYFYLISKSGTFYNKMFSLFFYDLYHFRLDIIRC